MLSSSILASSSLKKWWLNIQSKPLSSVQIPLNSSLLSIWSWFCACFPLAFLCGSASLYSSGILCPRMPLFQEGSWIILCVYHWWGGCAFQDHGLSAGSENSGADFPHLSSVLVFLEHLLVLWLCIAWYWLWVLSFCTWLIQTDILCCPFLQLLYTYGRGFTHWISKTNPFQFLGWLVQYICGMPVVPFQDLFLRCKDYQKGVKSALRELRLTLFWSFYFFNHF